MAYNAIHEASLMFVDIETTGLPYDSQILEIFATFPYNDQIEDFYWLATTIPNLQSMNEHVLEMHMGSELIEDIIAAKLDSSFGEFSNPREEFLNYVRGASQKLNGQVILAGNSVHFDRSVLMHGHNLHALSDVTSHRLLDVSAIKMGLEIGSEFVYEPTKKTAHRAIEDVQESIALWEAIKAFLEA